MAQLVSLWVRFQQGMIIKWFDFINSKSMQVNNTQLLAASKTITIHTLDSSSPSQQYNPHRGIVNCAVFNHTGKVIGSCGQDSKIFLHNAQKCQDKLLQFSYHYGQEEPSSINCCSFSPKSRYMAAGAVNSTVKIWEMKSGKQKEPFKKLKGNEGSITSISWLQGEQFLATSSTAGDIFIYDVMTGGIRDTLTNKIQQGINNIKVSESYSFRRLAACTNGGSLMVWDLLSSVKKPYYCYEDSRKTPFTSLSISSFKPVFFACSSLDTNITFFDINQKKVVKTLSTQEPLTSVSFNDDGQILAAGGINGSIMIYDLRKLTSPLLKLLGHDTPIKSICFLEKQREAKKKDSSVYSKVEPKDSGLAAGEVGSQRQPRTKTTPIINRPSEEERFPNKVKNLTKKEDPIQPQITYSPMVNTNLQTQQITVPKTTHSNVSPHISRPSTHTSQIAQPITSMASREEPRQKTKQKFEVELKNMEMRMNQKFEAVHLEVIRQNQMSVQKIMKGFEQSQMYIQQLQEKIKLLEMENQNLRKRTF